MWPFNSEKKRMSSCIKTTEGKLRLLTKGAAELVVERCAFVIGEAGDRMPLDQASRDELKSKYVKLMTEAALRAIAVAYKDLDSQEDVEQHEDEEEFCYQLTLISIFGIEDPVRDEVPRAISQCQEAGNQPYNAVSLSFFILFFVRNFSENGDWRQHNNSKSNCCEVRNSQI